MSSMTVEQAVLTIGDAIMASPHSRFYQFKKHDRLGLKKLNSVAFFVSGSVSLYRECDDILNVDIEAPSILGLPMMLIEEQTHYMRCNAPCEFWIINIEDALALFDEKNLWKLLFIVIARHMYNSFLRDSRIATPNTTEVVDKHLRYIWEMPPEVRKTVSIYSFILKRVQISRSAIHIAVKTLSEAGKIEVQRARLIRYNDPR